MIMLALFCTGLFLAQFLMSLIFGDDVDSSDIFSYKGLLHFGIGFSWSMWFTGDLLISSGVGILTAFTLAATYWLTLKLKKEIIPEKGDDLVGRVSEIYLSGLTEGEWIVLTRVNGGRRDIKVVSKDCRSYLPGDRVYIIGYEDGKYWIP